MCLAPLQSPAPAHIDLICKVWSRRCCLSASFPCNKDVFTSVNDCHVRFYVSWEVFAQTIVSHVTYCTRWQFRIFPVALWWFTATVSTSYVWIWPMFIAREEHNPVRETKKRRNCLILSSAWLPWHMGEFAQQSPLIIKIRAWEWAQNQMKVLAVIAIFG